MGLNKNKAFFHSMPIIYFFKINHFLKEIKLESPQSIKGAVFGHISYSCFNYLEGGLSLSCQGFWV